MRKRIALAVAGVALLFGLTGCTDEFKDNCLARQGFIKTDSFTTVTPVISPNGGVTLAVGVSTVRYCILNGKIDPTDIEVS